jgi:hypothetical protein
MATGALVWIPGEKLQQREPCPLSEGNLLHDNNMNPIVMAAISAGKERKQE